MRSKFKWIFTLLVALTMQFSFAQEKTVTGVVSDASGTLPGANVIVQGTTRGTQTDMDGRYSITARAGEVLVFSFVGMTDSSITVGGSNVINVTLSEGIVLIDVIVDGYKTTSKRKSSVAQTTVTSEVLEGRPNVSFLQSLQSQVAGLNIASSSGTPGSAKIDIVLRGLSSVNGNTEPLFVIDGLPANQTIFRGLNNEDIESITVLKDAGATAIYGNRGANGVIVINTKKGKFNSKLQVRYSGTTGFTSLQQNDYNQTNSREILTLEKRFGQGFGATLTDEEIAAWNINTKWRDYFFQTGLSQTHNLSFAQGGENATNFTSISYFNQEGIVPTTDFQRFTLRTNFSGKSTNNKFSYSTNVSVALSKRNQLTQETNSALNANVVQNPLQGVLSSLPYIDVNDYVNGQQLYDQFGTGDFTTTPLILLDVLQDGNIPNRYDETKIFANGSGTYKITDEFSYTATAGIDYTDTKRLFARAPGSWLAIAVREDDGTEFGGIEDISNDRDYSFNFQNRLNYIKVFNEKHTLDVNVFSEYVKAQRTTFVRRQDGLDPRTWSLGAGTGYVPFNPENPEFYVPVVGALKQDAGLFSLFATADYDYEGRFGLSGTIRRDASYRFVDQNKWGTFWSVSGRWNIDEESFMENSGFDLLKLRASYGTTGNQNLLYQGYGFNAIYAANNFTRDLNATGAGYDNSSAISVDNIANRDLRWETTAQTNIGLDFTIKKRFSGSLDVYRKKTTDVFDNNFISAVTGQYSATANTPATLLNQGIEVTLRYDVFKAGDFKMDVFVNASFNKNEYRDVLLGEGETEIDLGAVAQREGFPVYSYFVVPYLGVNEENGNMQFRAFDGSITEAPTDADRRLTNKNYIPSYQGGFGLNASYKGFFLNSNFSFVADVYRFDYDLQLMSDPSAIGSFPVVAELLNAWTPDNTNTNVPSLTAPAENYFGDNISDRFLRDASYIRLKNLAVGYSVPSKFLEKTFLSNVKIFTQLENYFTWSSWRGFDPENLNTSAQGGYPSPKVISFGVDVQF